MIICNLAVSWSDQRVASTDARSPFELTRGVLFFTEDAIHAHFPIADVKRMPRNSVPATVVVANAPWKVVHFVCNEFTQRMHDGKKFYCSIVHAAKCSKSAPTKRAAGNIFQVFQYGGPTNLNL
ncbi:hypothetical protein AC1031_007956 [Aphanomyces cochlioides]|nr:hypothetical protein AC1031_007956 [Aphanomyces cochlioides]